MNLERREPSPQNQKAYAKMTPMPEIVLKVLKPVFDYCHEKNMSRRRRSV